MTEKQTTVAPCRLEQFVMPVLLDYSERRKYPNCPGYIPMSALNEETAQRNHSQTLKRLAERGGLGPDEILAIMDRRKWKPMDLGAAIKEMVERLGLEA